MVHCPKGILRTVQGDQDFLRLHLSADKPNRDIPGALEYFAGDAAQKILLYFSQTPPAHHHRVVKAVAGLKEDVPGQPDPFLLGLDLNLRILPTPSEQFILRFL